jgi:hypothetical protein
MRRLLSGKFWRLVASTTFALVAVLLGALWVRSFWRYDVFVRQQPGSSLVIGSNWGAISWQWHDTPRQSAEWHHSAWSPVPIHEPITSVAWRAGATHPMSGVQHWFLVAIASALAAAPWLLRRFTIRTMMALTTLVAMFFAIAAASLRQ